MSINLYMDENVHRGITTGRMSCWGFTLHSNVSLADMHWRNQKVLSAARIEFPQPVETGFSS